MIKQTSYDPNFKAKVALEATSNERTIIEIAAEYNVAISLVSKWKSELLANANNTFGLKQKSPDEVEHKLYQQIGKLTMETAYLKKFVAKYQ